MSIYIQKIQSISNNSKYTKWYCNIIQNALDKVEHLPNINQKWKFMKNQYGYIERHHIIPSSFDKSFSNDKSNLAMLTLREHFICHILLTKMGLSLDLHKKALRAVTMFQKKCGKMKGSRTLSDFNSWEYKKLRECSSLAKTGSKGVATTLNKKCYSNGVNNIFRYVSDIIPDGYILGSTHKNSNTITNGIDVTRIFNGESIPDGWYIGNCKIKGVGKNTKGKPRKNITTEETRLKIGKSNSNNMWITDGKCDRNVKNYECIPDGWVRGRTNGIRGVGRTQKNLKCDKCHRFLGKKLHICNDRYSKKIFTLLTPDNNLILNITLKEFCDLFDFNLKSAQGMFRRNKKYKNFIIL